MTQPLALVGMRFGRLLVMERASNDKRGGTTWVCVCDCGKIQTAPARHLIRGATQSCGCLWREMSARGITTRHGQRYTPTYTTWSGIIDRCLNPKNHAYRYYGGRGITVCARWREFENFLADMGERPAGLTIDRIDNNGNYESGNCRWADRLTQSRNRRNTTRSATS